MSDKAFSILSTIVGVIFTLFLLAVVIFLGFAYFDCDFNYFLWGVQRIYFMTGGV